MTEQRPEVVAAALALAEACDAQEGGGHSYRVTEALIVYRAAIAPKRETVRDIVESWRRADGPNGNTAILLRLEAALVRETAPEPCLTCAECGLTRDQEPTVSMRWDDVVRCNNCANKRPVVPLEDPDPCSCDEAQALKERITQALAHLEHTSARWPCPYVEKAVEILRR